MIGHTALRRAVMERLRPFGTPQEGPWPTIAGPRVFDSQFDPIEGMLSAKPLPTILIYTEDADAPSGSATGGVPHQSVVQLVLELANVTCVKQALEGGEAISIISPLTDPALEASIDVLASQVRQLLVLEPNAAVKYARRRVEKFASIPFRDAEGGAKIATRALTLSCSLPTDEVAGASAVLGALDPASDSALLLTKALASVIAARDFGVVAVPLMSGVDVTVADAANPTGQTLQTAIPLTPPSS